MFIQIIQLNILLFLPCPYYPPPTHTQISTFLAKSLLLYIFEDQVSSNSDKGSPNHQEKIYLDIIDDIYFISSFTYFWGKKFGNELQCFQRKTLFKHLSVHCLKYTNKFPPFGTSQNLRTLFRSITMTDCGAITETISNLTEIWSNYNRLKDSLQGGALKSQGQRT